MINWRPKTPFFYGWLVLGMVALGAFVATSIAGVVLGGIQGFIFEDTGWSRSTIGLAAGTGVLASGLVAPFVGRLADRYGARWLIPSGTFFLGICLFSFIWVHSIWQFFLIAIVARAISQPLLIGIVPRTVAVNFFRRRRNLALALTGMFRPVSGAINIQLFALLAMAIGWRTTFQLLGIFSLLLTLPMILIIRRQPEDIGLMPDGDVSGEPESADLSTGRSRTASSPETAAEYQWTPREVFHTRSYWLIAVTTFLMVMASTGIAFNIVPYFQESAHLSSTQAVGVLSLSTSLALANLIWGYVSDRVNPRHSLLGVMIFMTGLVIFLFTIRSVYAAYVFGALWGIGNGALEVLIYMLLARYFGRGSFGSITGALRPFEAAGLGLGQIFGGLVYDLTGSYHGLFYESIVAYLLAVVFLFLAAQPARARPVPPEIPAGT
ncbi:MAG: MFS transporter [Chloroflexi bacterium]|nr:MFS transporter [Chloroflexota bacterium]